MLAEVYAVGAEFLARSLIASTGAFRPSNSSAGTACLPGWQGKFPGLKEAVDAEIDKAMGGLENRPLDDACRQAAARALQSVADQ